MEKRQVNPNITLYYIPMEKLKTIDVWPVYPQTSVGPGSVVKRCVALCAESRLPHGGRFCTNRT